jgi:hypothetical protein
MRQLLLVGVLFLVGCQGVEGPRARQLSPQPVNAPWLSIPEQEQRVRANVAIPDAAPSLAPRTFTEYPGPHGR